MSRALSRRRRFGPVAVACALTVLGATVGSTAWAATVVAAAPGTTTGDTTGVVDTTVPTQTTEPTITTETTVTSPTTGTADTTATTTTIATPTVTAPPASAPADSIPGGVDVDDDIDQGGDVVRQPALPPQVRSSDIPVGSIVLAVLVLAGVGLVSLVIARRTPSADDVQDDRRGHAPPGTTDPDAPRRRDRNPLADTAVLDFLLDLGESLIDAGDAVNHVESTLRTVAQVNGIDDVRVLALPTALIVSLPHGGDVTTEVSGAGRTQLRLDQIDDVLTLVADAEAGNIDPVAGRRRILDIRSSATPYPAGLALFGYVCSTMGLAAILRATWREVLLAAVLGVVIGAFRLSTRRLDRSAQPFVPLIAATAVSVSVFTAARIVDDLVTFPLLVAPLITFLPGALLTIAVLELATGQIVAGASRLASGGLQLVLLALGIVAGGQLVGVPAGYLRGGGGGLIATIAPWIGVAVFGIGVAMFHGARRSARIWILLVLYVAYSGQVIGGLFFGSALSAFFGALAMTPVAVLAARQPSGPAPLVTFLPGFWILVPGALGLEGVTRLLGDGGAAGTGALVTTITSMVGISLGILLGLTLVADDPQRPWSQAPPRS